MEEKSVEKPQEKTQVTQTVSSESQGSSRPGLLRKLLDKVIRREAGQSVPVEVSKEGGLREALAARMDKWSGNIKAYRENYMAEQEAMEKHAAESFHGKGEPVPYIYQSAKALVPFTNPLALAGSMLLAEKTTGFLRDRLQPNLPETPSQPNEL